MMASNNTITIFVTVTLLFYFFPTISCLSATRSWAHLPSERLYSSAVYDDDDNIYVLGGYNHTFVKVDEIVRFTISTEVIGRINMRFNPVFHTLTAGSAVWVGNGDVIHFGGQLEQSLDVPVVSKVNLNNRTMHAVASLQEWFPMGETATTAVWDGGDNTYIFGGKFGYNSAIRYQINTNTLTKGTIPGSQRGCSSIWDHTTGTAYIFGGDNSENGQIMKYSPVSGVGEVLPVRLPRRVDYSTAVFDGTFAYIIGGYQGSEPYSGVTRFNPKTNEVTEIVVENFPAKLNLHSSVYVKKLNRIYILGGVNSDFVQVPTQILYIDLNKV